MTNMKRAAVVAVLMTMGTAIAVAGVKVQTQRDPKFDFSQLKTWSWNPSGPGDVKVWVTAESKSEPVKRKYEPVIMQAVEDELARRGLSRASGSPPDFSVTYYLLITVGTDAQHMGQFVPAVAQWGLPPFAPQTTALTMYPQGSLVLDIGSPDPSHVVWRAVAQAEIDLERTEAQRAVRIRNVVRDVVAKLPRKK
jgi:Domain of unknown function (DUF4136)